MTILHSIEALPGAGRYAVTFRRTDGAEQTAVVQLAAGRVTAAEASLPAGWTLGSETFLAVADAVLAVERARESLPPAAALTDIDGGWDVMMGNVVLGPDDEPSCTAHGPMQSRAGWVYVCIECGARAAYAAVDDL